MKSGAARPKSRRGEGARLRDDIVAAATELIELTGNEDAVTLRGVARQAGITAPSIYAHFASRDAVVSAVVSTTFAELAEALARAAAASADAVGRLRSICDAYLDFAAARPHRFTVLFGRIGETVVPAAARPVGHASGPPAFRILVDAIAECVGEHVSDSRDPTSDAVALWVALHGYALLQLTVPSFPWPRRDTILDTLVERLARVRG